MSSKHTVSSLFISGALHAALAVCIIFALDKKDKETTSSIVVNLDSFNLEQTITQQQLTKKQQSNPLKQATSSKQQELQSQTAEEKDKKEAVNTKTQNVSTDEKPKNVDIPSKLTQTQENYKKHLPIDESEEYIRLNKAKVKEAVAKYQVYPSSAKKSGCEGTCLISFRLYPNGSINETKIIKSSGFSTLDRSALRALENAVPELPKPNRPVTIVIPIEYIL